MIISWIRKSEISNVVALNAKVRAVDSGTVCFFSDDVGSVVTEDNIRQWMNEADIVHSGLSFGSGKAFEAVQLCTFNWHFLNPRADVPCVSWKATLDFVAFDQRLFEAIGAMDQQYSSVDAALMDWVYRALAAGAKPIFQPILGSRLCTEPVRIGLSDELRFVSKHFNKRAQSFFRFCQIFLNGRLFRSRAPFENSSNNAVIESSKLTNGARKTEITGYSALIPTIDRYAYIGNSIDSLLRLPFPPHEIVVVDQTPAGKRQPEVYAPYLERGILKLIFLDRAGQSTARNKGLEQVTQPWVLLFEDDAEAWSDMVDEHINLIVRSGCDVSTGVVVPPGAGADFIPSANRRYFLSDILTTGNAFMKTATALSVGGFDLAFDHGPGADDDFGKRLYMSGKVIIYNYKSIETHHKAPKGGMRVHGIWWRNKSTVLGPYPPVTQSFTIMKYYPIRFRVFLFLNMILKARKKYSTTSYLFFVLMLPYKLSISIWRALQLRKH